MCVAEAALQAEEAGRGRLLPHGPSLQSAQVRLLKLLERAKEWGETQPQVKHEVLADE